MIGMKAPAAILFLLVYFSNLEGGVVANGRLARRQSGLQGAHVKGVGQGDGRRIVGGIEATGSYMWVTLITKLGGYSITCTGELITDRWMVTAAHCMLNTANNGYRVAAKGNTQIVYGCLAWNDPSCKTVGAKRFVAHPCYTPSNDQDHDDIALIELDAPVVGMEGKFALVDGLNGTVDMPEDAELILAGFGAQRPDGSDGRAPKLMEVKVKGASKQTCIDANPYSFSKQYINFDHIICTGGPAGKDSCNGDSGGPAIALKDGQPWLVGILSKGSQNPESTNNCAASGRLGMYTRIQMYGKWILGNLRGDARVNTCSACPDISIRIDAYALC